MSSKSERLDLRLAPENKQILQEAAVSLGVSVTEFVLDVAVAAARRVRDEQETRALSSRDRAAFLKILDEAPQPNQALRAAFETVKAQRGS